MLELTIIKYLLNKEIYNKYITLIKPPTELKQHYKVLYELHKEFNRDLTLEEYLLHAKQQGCDYLDTLESSNVGHDSMEKLIKTLCERSWAHSAALLSVDVSEGRRELSELLEHYSKLDSIQVMEETQDEFVTDDISEILKTTDKDEGLQFRLPTLRAQLGGQKQGSFGFLFARSNVGKTTFAASEMSYFARQTDKPVIWFNNEQEKHVVKLRLIQSALGWTDEQIKHDPKRTLEEYMKITKGNLKLVDMSSMHKLEVERIVKLHKPAAILLDSIDALQGFKAATKDVLFGDIYNWARMLAKDHCAVIGICQASVSAENKKYLLDSDIEESKTSKSTEADWILGIGKTFNLGGEDIRYIHIIKDKYSCPIKRIQCRIQPNIGRYCELG